MRVGELISDFCECTDDVLYTFKFDQAAHHPDQHGFVAQTKFAEQSSTCACAVKRFGDVQAVVNGFNFFRRRTFNVDAELADRLRDGDATISHAPQSSVK